MVPLVRQQKLMDILCVGPCFLVLMEFLIKLSVSSYMK